MEQQALKPQSQIIEAEATTIEPGTPLSKMDSIIVLFFSTGLCGVVMGIVLYFLPH